MTTNHLLELHEHGQSVWMDNLSRDIIQSGQLAEMVQTQGIRGITSNPAIFEKAIAGNAIYDSAIRAGIETGKSINDIYESLVFEDIQNAADILKPVFVESKGEDGYVSIEVSPNLAHDTAGTIAEALRFWNTLKRPNIMIKIPGTDAGFGAIAKVIAEGIPVNVTLLFSVSDYEKTAWAFIEGLEARVSAGGDISQIASVASFFLSRIDSKIDALLDAKIKATTDESEIFKLSAIKGKVAIANAKIAYQKYKEIYAGDRWQALKAKGAKEQRLLWASTSTKNPTYSDVMYVDNLVGENTVNTMPPETIAACIDHCDIEDRIEIDIDAAYKVIDQVKAVGLDLDQIMMELQTEGVDKFVKPFASLIASLETKVNQLTAA
ncbi:transaldolase [Synechococcus sp. PCC 7502]|uniref:transaldolase n=1 Tax=Synechococcus sp. PCC 7502 TaxID=1173263 RepID=UPI00029FDD8D|nr:transaldolase [Synechococcus sp. PCC 7502]AFY73055.1 transaldolase [Synechococcus sp. PCC 7502]